MLRRVTLVEGNCIRCTVIFVLLRAVATAVAAFKTAAVLVLTGEAYVEVFQKRLHEVFESAELSAIVVQIDLGVVEDQRECSFSEAPAVKVKA